MHQDAKKTARRVIPYGIDLLTADDGKGNVAGEVTKAHLPKAIDGRPNAAILEMKDLGGSVCYGE